jgi:hypothetical protein
MSRTEFDDLSLLRLFDPESEVSRSELESFIGNRLADAGVWDARTSDGISLLREIERTDVLARFCGQIWSIDQTLHTFWLDIERLRHELDWTLYFDALIDSPRAARNAGYALARPDEAEWQVTLSGRVKKIAPGG